MAITVTNFVDYDGTDIHTQALDYYPIGSIFINTSNINPSSFIGGVWESYGTGRTLVGVSPGDTDFNTPNKMGGVKNQELRALIGAVQNDAGTIGYYATRPAEEESLHFRRANMRVNGNAQGQGVYTFNHSTVVIRDNGENATTVQPYITVYFWRRIQ